MTYSPIVTEHFFNPRNVGRLDAPDAVGSAGSPHAGEFAVIQLRVSNDLITDTRFQTYGCGPAIAACSVLTEWLKGKAVAEAGQMSSPQLVEMLGGLPEDKLFCAELAITALRDALSRLGASTQVTGGE